MKQFRDFYNGELSEFRVISKAQRRKIALRMKRLTKSAAFKKKVEKSKLRVANPAKQRVKAAKMAKQKVDCLIVTIPENIENENQDISKYSELMKLYDRADILNDLV